MKHITSSERRSDIREIRQFLQTLHKKLFQNRKIIDKINQKESMILLIRELSNNIRTIKEASHRDICFVIILI
jgi:hypothetical protein